MRDFDEFWLLLGLMFTVIFHHVMVITNTIAFFCLPFLVNPLLSAPLCSFIAFLFTNSVNCPLTDLENYFRKKLGMSTIDTFIKDYYIIPAQEIIKDIGEFLRHG